uniref:Uncharacterized protein n=1 Tax=Rhizophora mucronata TaxID=61149 RepID=A0A2P2QJ46_RHIMU
MVNTLFLLSFLSCTLIFKVFKFVC